MFLESSVRMFDRVVKGDFADCLRVSYSFHLGDRPLESCNPLVIGLK